MTELPQDPNMLCTAQSTTNSGKKHIYIKTI